MDDSDYSRGSLSQELRAWAGRVLDDLIIVEFAQMVRDSGDYGVKVAPSSPNPLLTNKPTNVLFLTSLGMPALCDVAI